MNKRITSLLLCFVMIVAMLATAVPAFAAGTNNGISVSADQVEQGGTVTVTLKIPAIAEKMSDCGFKISFDKAAFDVEAYVAPTVTGAASTFYTSPADAVSHDPAFVSAVYNGGGLNAIDLSAGYTWNVNFKAKDTAALGEYTFEWFERKMVSLDEADGFTEYDRNPANPVTRVTVRITGAPKPATGISVTPTSLTLVAGQTDTSLSANVTPADTTDTVAWSSGNTAAATVNPATGAVTAVAPGTAVITATAGTKKATCTVTVTCAHSLEPVAEKASNCTEKGWDSHQKCTICNELFDLSGVPIAAIPYRALNDDHDFNTAAWGYKEADGHAHICNRNSNHHSTPVAHTPGPAATETTPQVCTVCGYIIQDMLVHNCANSLDLIPAVPATCTTPGNTAYYKCRVDNKLYEDATALVEITDPSSVILSALGHDYSVKNSDEAHKKSTAADCREHDTYWFTCANDASHSAEDDPAAADKFYNGEATGAHVFGTELVDIGPNGHAHKCLYHDVYDTAQPHTPDHQGGATYDYAVICTDCGHVIEAQIEEPTVRVEIPYKLEVKKTGEKDPGKETFKFVIENFGAPSNPTLVQDTLETDGEKVYDGSFVFTIKKRAAGNLSEGFKFRQVKGNAEGWTYDEKVYYAIPMFVDSYEQVVGWTFFTLKEDGTWDESSEVRELTFVNSYNAKNPPAPPVIPDPPKPPVIPDPPKQPEENKSPQTGESRKMAPWLALLLLFGAAATGTALYSRKKRISSR